MALLVVLHVNSERRHFALWRSRNVVRRYIPKPSYPKNRFPFLLESEEPHFRPEVQTVCLINRMVVIVARPFNDRCIGVRIVAHPIKDFSPMVPV